MSQTHLALPPPLDGNLRAAFAADVVRTSARLVRRVQSELAGKALAKDDRSPVTVADYAAQAFIAHRLAESFSGDLLVGEEDSSVLNKPQGAETLDQVVRFVEQQVVGATASDVRRWIDFGGADGAAGRGDAFWTLDPVDGTKGFLRGDQYAVALAYITEGKVQIGALGCPELVDGVTPQPGGPGSLIVAVRGGGAWTQSIDSPSSTWRRLAVSGQQSMAEARVLRSVESGHTDGQGIDALMAALAISAPPVPLDSQAKYAVLAAGGGEALLRLLSPSRPDYREKIWDQGAGSIVIEEAGGRVTDLDGKPLDFSHGRTLAKNRGVLATNGSLHDAFLAGLNRVFG